MSLDPEYGSCGEYLGYYGGGYGYIGYGSGSVYGSGYGSGYGYVQGQGYGEDVPEDKLTLLEMLAHVAERLP